MSNVLLDRVIAITPAAAALQQYRSHEEEHTHGKEGYGNPHAGVSCSVRVFDVAEKDRLASRVFRFLLERLHSAQELMQSHFEGDPGQSNTYNSKTNAPRESHWDGVRQVRKIGFGRFIFLAD